MTLQSSGPISMNDINIELGRSSGASINLNDAAVRALAGVPSGTISLSNFYGKSSFTIGFDNVISRTRGGSSPSSIYLDVTLNTNGTVSAGGGFGLIPTRWGTPTTTGIGSQYEVLLQVTNSGVDGGGSGDYVRFAGQSINFGYGANANTSWYALSTARVLQASAETGDGDGGFSYAEGRIYVRQISNPSNIANTTFAIYASADQ